MADEADLEDAYDAEWHLLYNQAIEQVIALESETEPVRTALRALMTRLELSQDDLGRMLGVSGETVRRWERGATGIPAERVLVIIENSPAHFAMEGGRVLPNPGEEAAWLAAQ